MTSRRKTPTEPSASALAAVTANIAAFNRTRHLHPTCSATAKSTGEPCRRFAMPNGKCDIHGGKTPRGKQWHKPQAPTGGARSAEKLERKLRAQEKARRERAARLSRMTPEDRAAHDAWHRVHAPGDPAKRATERERRRQDRNAAAVLAAPRVAEPSAEARAMASQLEELRAELRAHEAARNNGVFG